MSEEWSPAVKFFAALHMEQEKVRGCWRKDAGELLDAHQLAFSALAGSVQRFAGKTFSKAQSKSVEGRLSLTAQFVQGVDACETAISCGLYSQAACLLKQQMETVEAVHEHEMGRRRDRVTPRLPRLKEFGRVYGQYNEFAHVSVSNIANLVVRAEHGDVCGPSILPLYNADIAYSFYGMHVFLIVSTAGQVHTVLTEIYGEGLNEDEMKFLIVAVELVKKSRHH